MQEIQTLPVGPVEVSSVWYAQSRLAYSTLGFHIWAEGVEEMHTVLSRAMEKTVAYSMAALWHVLEQRGDTVAYDHLVLWSDGGSNFQNSTVIGTLGHDMLVRFSWTCSVELRGTQAFQEPVGRGLRGALAHQTPGVLAPDAGGWRRRRGGLPCLRARAAPAELMTRSYRAKGSRVDRQGEVVPISSLL